MRFANPREERRLIKGLKAGKPDAQRKLYDLCAGKLMAVCMRYARSREEAEDLLQEGFIRVFNKVGQFKGEGSFEGWVRRVITNIAIRQYQKNSRIHIVVGLDESEPTYGADLLEQQFATEDLLDKVQRLPDGYRTVFNLFAIEGYSHDEISKKLDISVGTSKSQLNRARKALRLMIEVEEDQHRTEVSNG